LVDLKKRNLFRRASSPFKSYIYPPYYQKKEDFLECIECEDKNCLIACKEKIITIKDNIPIITFGKNGCTFCDECAKACKKVLKQEHKKTRLNAEMIINPDKCIAWNKTICYACEDICEEAAIMYQGMFNPVIDLDKCSACGFCISVCPADAIEVKVI